MSSNNLSEQILKDYEVKSQAILDKMMKVLLRAHRKVDDEAYAKVLEKMNQEK